MSTANKSMFIIAFILSGILITCCAHAAEWQTGTDADIKRVFRLVYDGRAVVTGQPGGAWKWKCIDKRGCEAS